MSKKNDIVVGASISSFAIFYLVSASKIRIFRGAGATVINSHTMPMIWGWLLLVLGVALAISGIRSVLQQKKLEIGNSREHTEGMASQTGGVLQFLLDNWVVVGTIGLLAVYILIMKTVGFVLSSTGYLVLQSLLLIRDQRKKKLPFVLLLSIIVSVGTYVLFVRSLNVPLPAGVLFS